MEAGDVVPTEPLLRRMAAQYQRPLLTFYLPKVPAPAELGHDFRTLPEQGDPSNVLLTTLLRDVKARQALAREILEDDEDAVAVGLVGAAAGTSDPDVLAAVLIETIGFDRVAFRAQARAEDAFG